MKAMRISSITENVGHALVNSVMKNVDNLTLEEIEFFNKYIPRPKSKYFSTRSTRIFKMRFGDQKLDTIINN